MGAVMAATGLRVDVLSGREEAELSFRGAIQNAGLYTGLLADLGGGSTELVSYRNRAIQSACSLSVGSLSLFSKYVSKLHPTKEERRAIRRAVEEQLEQFVPQHPPARHICGVGGTVRAACKVANAMFDRPAGDREPGPGRAEGDAPAAEEAGQGRAAAAAEDRPGPDSHHHPRPAGPGHHRQGLWAQTITASACGVREGYLLARVAGGTPGGPEQNHAST